ncbi:hypothetical protein CN271_16505 [Bacillus cereus]|nr:hypothetical protein CON59_32250 [Bacillus cereus]PET35950.1 hypothetical protein CN523_30650 [Bacillus cereus]PEV76258.1 hypothetical protein CN429_20695 [Bacillus cereus]PFA41568.1 hypothetical protein CN389_29545 [Bacillus cereus]PFD70914.1 hypothetical protein CN271_16505 [Bacillus cereus]
MNKYQKIPLMFMIGLPAFFLILSVITNNWRFFFWSLAPSFTSGMTGYFIAKNSFKGINKNV